MNLIEEFLEWFGSYLLGITDIAWEILKRCIFVFFAVITSPIWLLPFIFWYFAVRGERKEGDS